VSIRETLRRRKMASQQENEQQMLYTSSVPNEPTETEISQVRREGGRLFQDQWIRLVREHCPDNPRTEKLLPWED
jgi:hypothetical protein